MHFQGDLHGHEQVLHRARNDDAGGINLVDAGVGAVQPARALVAAHLALDVQLQMLDQSLLPQVAEIEHVVIIVAIRLRRLRRRARLSIP